MKKKKLGIISSAVATCAICASMIVGSTYALFTSNDQVDVTITSGKVAVTTEIKNATITSATSVTETEAIYDENSVVTNLKAEDNGLTMQYVMPGDKMDFDLVLANVGTVEAKYQYSLGVTAGYVLFAALDVEITDADAEIVFNGNKLKGYQSAWGALEASETATYHVTLTLRAA